MLYPSILGHMEIMNVKTFLTSYGWKVKKCKPKNMSQRIGKNSKNSNDGQRSELNLCHVSCTKQDFLRS